MAGAGFFQTIWKLYREAALEYGGLQHELDGFGNAHEVARYSLVSQCNGATISNLLAK